VTEAAGSLAEEAAKLFGAAEEWWRAHAPSDLAHTGPECRVCPICQLVSVVRGAQPELFEHLTDAANSLMAALRTAVEAQERAWTRKPGDVPVERIDIS
jgi:hypothetical protein